MRAEEMKSQERIDIFPCASLSNLLCGFASAKPTLFVWLISSALDSYLRFIAVSRPIASHGQVSVHFCLAKALI